MHEIYSSSPNTTIVLPGVCNARCSFCFWNSQDNLFPVSTDDYIKNLLFTLRALPRQFSTVSLSGGEPTISPCFSRVLQELAILRRTRSLDRVVLHSNGSRILDHLPLIGATVDHINISRHHYDSALNRQIFDSPAVPSDDELMTLVKRIHDETNCTVTLNCVIKRGAYPNWCKTYLAWAFGMGVDDVVFRQECGDLRPSRAEDAFIAELGDEGEENSCPVCRSRTQLYTLGDRQMQITWKAGILEPSATLGQVFECVIRQDGLPYADWAGQISIQPSQLRPAPAVGISSASSDLVFPVVAEEAPQNTRTSVGAGEPIRSPAVGCGNTHGVCGAWLRDMHRHQGGCGGGGCG